MISILLQFLGIRLWLLPLLAMGCCPWELGAATPAVDSHATAPAPRSCCSGPITPCAGAWQFTAAKDSRDQGTAAAAPQVSPTFLHSTGEALRVRDGRMAEVLDAHYACSLPLLI